MIQLPGRVFCFFFFFFAEGLVQALLMRWGQAPTRDAAFSVGGLGEGASAMGPAMKGLPGKAGPAAALGVGSGSHAGVCPDC